MVAWGNFSPDPSNKLDENFVPSNLGVIPPTHSDEEEISYEGYQVLSQDVVENSGNVDDTESEEDSSEEETEVNVNLSDVRDPPSFDQSTKLEVTELWNSTNSNRQGDIVIDSTKEEQIKNAMAGFKLPSSSIPSWASEIPEEEWKEQLKNRVALLNK